MMECSILLVKRTVEGKESDTVLQSNTWEVEARKPTVEG